MEQEKWEIRRAGEQDIPDVMRLLGEVLELHAALRPDLFIAGTTKYTPQELKAIFADEKTPVFVAAAENGAVAGYAFCVLKRPPFTTNMRDIRTLYIDDICIDERCRGQHIGRALYERVLAYARAAGCYDVTLNVWEGNANARAFYEKMGMRVKETQMETIL